MAAPALIGTRRREAGPRLVTASRLGGFRASESILALVDVRLSDADTDIPMAKGWGIHAEAQCKGEVREGFRLNV